MKRKVDSITKQVETQKEKDLRLGGEMATINSDLVKERELLQQTIAKQSALQQKHNSINTD